MQGARSSVPAIVDRLSLHQNELKRDMVDSWIGRETGTERHIGEECAVEYAMLRRSEMRMCVEWTPGQPSGEMLIAKNTALIDRGVNGNLESQIDEYRKNQAECVIGEAEECHAKCRAHELMGFHLGGIEDR